MFDKTMKAGTDFILKHFQVISLKPIINPRDLAHEKGLIHAPARGVERRVASFVYAIKFSGYYPVGSVAIVVAQDALEALRLFRTTLFLQYNKLYKDNFEGDNPLDLASVSVFCAAHTDQIGKVTVLLDGEY